MKFLKKLKEAFKKRLEVLCFADCEKRLVSSHKRLFQSLYQAKVVENALNVGAKVPIDLLQDCFGETLSVQELLKKGPILIKFYRGSWCPFCLADLQFMHEQYDIVTELGATGIAISTQLPEISAQLAKENGYKFRIVPDVNAEIARKFGLVFKLSEEVALAYKANYGLDLLKYHKDMDAELALPACYIISQTGEITYAFLDEDFRKRADIEEVVHFIKKAKRDRSRYMMRCEQESCFFRDFFKGVKQLSRSKTWSLPSRKSRGSVSSSSDIERDPLKYCLENEDYFASFKDYLNKTFCTENLLFYLEAGNFQDFYQTMKEQERTEVCTNLINTFVKVGADLEINIDDQTRETILNAFGEGKITSDLFQAASKEVYTLLQTDSFLKWKKTREFKELWQKNGCPEFLSPAPELAAAA